MYLSISANEIKTFKLWFGICAVVGSHLLASTIVIIPSLRLGKTLLLVFSFLFIYLKDFGQ
jgi:hypothetical protein